MALPETNAFPRIVRDPRILGGEPTIKGTRIPVRVLVVYRRHEPDLTHLFEDYPRLTQADFDEALAYYEAHPEEIDRYIRESGDDM
jgi:uncharacterized protein (DUF433 family)